MRLWLTAAVAVALTVAVAAVVALIGGREPVRPADSTSPFAGSLMPSGVAAPAVRLRDQDNARLDLRHLRGEVVIVTFVYATCTESCGPQLQLVRRTLDELGRDVPALAITADPENDTASLARRFLVEQRVTGRVRFLLGSPQTLAPIYRGFFVQPQTDTEEHHARIVLLDRQGFQRVGYTLTDTTPKDIVHDIRVLEAQAS